MRGHGRMPTLAEGDRLLNTVAVAELGDVVMLEKDAPLDHRQTSLFRTPFVLQNS